MPRDGSGQYHVPVGTDGVPDTTIESSKYNLYVHDVETDLNTPRPISSGGTGATLPDEALDNFSAEKFKQVVTEWDSTVWRAGSFYAATTAIGAAPVAGHAFAGIAYYANATDLVLEATDLTDVSDPTVVNQYIRVMTAGVWGPWTRKTAVVPIPGSLGEYTFDSALTFPPAAGQIRFNNATQNSTTEVFISHLSTLGIDNSGVIPFALKSGYDFYIQDKDEPVKWKMFTATADPILSGGDFRVTAVFKSGSTDVVSGQRMLFGANSGASASTYAVRYDAAQTLTAAQRSQARANIDVTKKNYIINGAMMVSQENGSTGVTFNGYPVDQFRMIGTTSANTDCAQVAVKTPAGSPNRIRQFVSTTIDTSIAAGDFCMIYQPIEGLRIVDLGLGTAAAKTVTLQFGVKAPAGTYCVALGNTARSYVAEYVIAAGEANTDVVKSIVIPLDTAGVWNTDNALGLNVQWTLMAGSTYRGTAGVWLGPPDILATANQYNFFSVANSTFELFDVSLTEGTVAPPFQVPDYTAEVMACKRFWEVVNVTFSGRVTLGYNYYALHQYEIEKRVAATITSSQAGLGGGSIGVRAVVNTFPRYVLWYGIANATHEAGGFNDVLFVNARL